MLRFIFYVNIFKGIILSAVSQRGSGGGREALPWMVSPGLGQIKNKMGWTWPPKSHGSLAVGTNGSR